MRHHFWKPTLLALTAVAMTGVAPALVSAQERPDDHKAMRADEHRDEHRDQSRDEHRDQNRDEHQRGDDEIARYRHDHPRSSARCHDGFFTSTHDRNRACTKHGGIDVWLSL